MMKFERPIHRPVAGRLALWALWLPQIVIAILVMALRKFPKSLRQFTLKDWIFMTYAYITVAVGGVCLFLLSLDMNEAYVSNSYFAVVTGIQAAATMIVCGITLALASWKEKNDRITFYVLSVPIIILFVAGVIGISVAIGYLYIFLYPIPMLPVSSGKKKKPSSKKSRSVSTAQISVRRQ
jgi:hypothetical protein